MLTSAGERIADRIDRTRPHRRTPAANGATPAVLQPPEALRRMR
jgi:hypothetical protein